ncbi:MAG: hypothetical protein WBN31_11440 [Gammaproteobacteria bacterium]
MKRGPGFLHGVALALVLAFAGAAVFASLTSLMPVAGALRFVVSALALAYAVYLLRVSNSHTGRIAALAVYLTASALALWIAPGVPELMILHTLMIWLIRSLFFHDGVLAALADLGLSGLALAGAVWAVSSSGSVFLALWSFFLVQALFVALPGAVSGSQAATIAAATGSTRNTSACGTTIAGFERAHRSAENALRRLSARS